MKPAPNLPTTDIRNQDSQNLAQSIIRKQFLQNKLSWSLSSCEGMCFDENHNEIPWITYPATQFLKNYLHSNHEIFEFGCGTSTLFFSQRARKTFSLETRRFWFDFICTKLAAKSDCEILKNHFVSEKNEIFLIENEMDEQNYCSFLTRFSQQFDLILVDSAKRFQCSIAASKHLKPEGFIILDDSQRLNYKKIFDFFEKNEFHKTDFWGIAPGQITLKNTSFFTKLHQN